MLFKFGVYEADAGKGELRKHGLRVKLHAQPFQVLTMMLERPGELVSREEMRTRLWGSDTFVDFDHGLNTAVNKIRDALNDSAARPRYVETVPGKGYRFVAPVERVDEVAPAAPATTAVQHAGRPGVLSTPEELPAPPRKVVRILILMVQALYLTFYLTALANLREVDDVLAEAQLWSPAVMLGVVAGSAAAGIPVRLYLAAAAAFDLRTLPRKFARMFPWLLILDLVWSLSPFLLAHSVSVGMAIGLCAILVYLPFAQRSLVLMYGRGR